jgi:hypothetical protein
MKSYLRDKICIEVYYADSRENVPYWDGILLFGIGFRINSEKAEEK